MLRFSLVALLLISASRNLVAVGVPPTITTQPRNVTVGVGIPVTLFVSSTPFSSAGKTHQWFRDGVPIETATNSSLVLPPVSFSDAATYSVAVSNEFGGTISAPATISVVPNLQLRHISSIAPPRTQTPIGLQGAPMWVKVVDNLAYIATKRLHIYDVSNRSEPVLLSNYGSGSSGIYSLFVQGQQVYVTDNSNLEVIDVSDPALPRRLSQVPIGKTGADVVVRGDFAYVAAFGAFKIFNVRNPTNVVPVAELSTPTLYTVDLSGDVAYLAATSQGIYVVDISDPAAPGLITILPPDQLQSFVDSVKVAGNRLYSSGTGIAVYDISNPRQPRRLAEPRRTQPSASQGLGARNEFIFTGDKSQAGLPETGWPFFSAFDASNPANIIEVARHTLTNRSAIEGIDIVGSHIYAAIGSKVEIFEWTSATNAPVLVQPMGNPLSVPGAPALLGVHASGGGEHLAFQWAREGVDLPGETNHTLRIPAITPALAGDYSVTVSNSVGHVISTGRLSLTEPSSLNLSLHTRDSRGPRLTFTLPEGLQARLQSTSDFTSWNTVWSGQAPGGVLDLFDTQGRGAPQRTYRLLYGLE